MPTLRYVVLHHTGFDEAHFDLMIESAPAGALTTWRCPRWPLASGDELTSLADHRCDYLDYEGLVSNNRGQVRRVAAGMCDYAISPSFPPMESIVFLEPLSMTITLVNVVEPDRRTTDRWTVKLQ
jgi:hypothetical protein